MFGDNIVFIFVKKLIGLISYLRDGEPSINLGVKHQQADKEN